MLRIPEHFATSYSTTKNKVLEEQFDVSSSTILRWAKAHGLRKDKAHTTHIQAERMNGRKRSKETRQKISDARMTSHRSGNRKPYKRTAPAPKGESHYKWKGGKPWPRFKDPDYLVWRSSILQRDKYICQNCSRQCKKNEGGLVAHHIKPYATHPELRLDMSNGQTLCRMCHIDKHSLAPKCKTKIPCACGCGTMIDPFDRHHNRPRSFVNHHHSRRLVNCHPSEHQKTMPQTAKSATATMAATNV